MVTVRFTFSDAETRRMLRYIVLRSKGPVALLGCGIVLLAIGAAVGKATWFAIAGVELFGWLGLVTLMPRAAAPRGRRRAHASASPATG